tara:strand:+ start:51143 stop:52306 length:1164 start_codon:yes stop_codon:yes gene_type:complete
LKITNIEYFTLRCSLSDDYPKPVASFVTEGSIFLRVHTDNGIIGIGEPSPYGGTLKQMIKILKDTLIPNMIGQNPLDIEKLTFQNHIGMGYGNVGYNALVAGISQALWDIYGKVINKPIYKIINPESDGKIKAYASAGMWFDQTPLEEIVEEALKYLDEGFTVYKLRPETPIKAGNHIQRNLNPPNVNLKRFIELLQKIYFNSKGNLKIMVDAGCRLHFDQAIYLCEAMREINCFFLEEPIPRDYKQYCKLKENSKIPLAGGESLVSELQFMPWIENNALDYLQPDANLAGINEIIKIDKLALANKLQIVLHNWTNAINCAANVHLGAALKSCKLIETNLTYNPLKSNLLVDDIVLKNGEFLLSEKPGLGVELNESALHKYSFNANL